MKIHSINKWIPDADVARVRAEGGFIIVTHWMNEGPNGPTKDEVYLNPDGREVLRVVSDVVQAKKHWWLRLQDWLDRKFPRRTPEQIAKLEAEVHA
jgi:hypothetical protein